MNGSTTTPLSPHDWRQRLTAMRQVLDHLLAALEAAEAMGVGTKPASVTAAGFCRSRRISMPRLQAYWDCGMPHRRQGKATVMDVAVVDAWLAANLATPAVQRAVRAALTAARGRRTAKPTAARRGGR